MEHLYQCRTLGELSSIAADILKKAEGPKVFALHGEMGSGKTTLIKAFCSKLETLDTATSPTFALVNEYRTANVGPVYHFDVYRIRKIEELMDIGYETYFYSGHYVFIEWPELITELLPDKYVYISIKETDDGSREILLKI